MLHGYTNLVVEVVNETLVTLQDFRNEGQCRVPIETIVPELKVAIVPIHHHVPTLEQPMNEPKLHQLLRFRTMTVQTIVIEVFGDVQKFHKSFAYVEDINDSMNIRG
jgi:hypothetical protein